MSTGAERKADRETERKQAARVKRAEKRAQRKAEARARNSAASRVKRRAAAELAKAQALTAEELVDPLVHAAKVAAEHAASPEPTVELPRANVLRMLDRHGQPRRVKVARPDGQTEDVELERFQVGVYRRRQVEALAENLPTCACCKRKVAPIDAQTIRVRGTSQLVLCQNCPRCSMCNQPVSVGTMDPRHVASRGGRPPHCLSCAQLVRANASSAEIEAVLNCPRQCACGAPISVWQRRLQAIRERDMRPPTCRPCHHRALAASMRGVSKLPSTAQEDAAKKARVLSDAVARQVFDALSDGWTAQIVAKRFGISPHIVHAINTGRSYGDCSGFRGVSARAMSRTRPNDAAKAERRRARAAASQGLSDDEAIAALGHFAAGATLSQVASRMGICKAAAKNLKRGKTYGHLDAFRPWKTAA